MISERHFDEFIAPYYRRLVPRLQEMGTMIFADTDGDVTRMVPWLLREGIQGVEVVEGLLAADHQDRALGLLEPFLGRPI